MGFLAVGGFLVSSLPSKKKKAEIADFKEKKQKYLYLQDKKIKN